MTRRDVPIFITALGTVTASNTVQIRSQIDGRLKAVSFREGQEVHQGDLLAEIDPRLYQAELDQAKAKKIQDEAQLVGAQKDLARYQALGAREFGTQQAIDQQQAKVDALKATIEADAASIEMAQTQLDYTKITAPIDGRTGLRKVDVGNIIHTSDTNPIVVLTQLKPISVIFTLPEKKLDRVRAAERAGPVEALAFDQANTRQLATGRLVLLDNEIDQATGTIRLKAEFPNGDEALWPGEFVNIRLELDTRKNALTIPSAAVQRGPDGPFVWVVDDGNVVQPRRIRPGPLQGDVAIVNEGISDKDRVVVSGQYKLDAGTRVEIQAAAPAKGDQS